MTIKPIPLRLIPIALMLLLTISFACDNEITFSENIADMREDGVGEKSKAALLAELSDLKTSDGIAHAVGAAADVIEGQYSACVDMDSYTRELCRITLAVITAPTS